MAPTPDTHESPTSPGRPRPAPRGQGRLLLVVGLLGAALVAAAGASVAVLVGAETPALQSDPAWLEVKLAGALADAPGGEGLLADPADLPPLQTELVSAIRHAATDDEVKGLYLQIGGLDMGWASLQELRSAVQAFEAAGKPCIAWASAYTTREYYLATGCSRVELAPAGLFFVNGMSTTQMYFGETFKRYGVTANFEHVGDFKSAVEPYERTGPSEAAQQATDALLDSIYAQLLAGISEGRKIDGPAAQAVLDDPPMTPEDAKARGLVDALRYPDEVLAEVGGDDRTKLKAYLRARRSEWSSGLDEIAVIYAEGAIIDGSGGQDMFGGRYIGDRSLNKLIREAREDDDIKAVVLRVNSPGGSGSASDAIWRELQLTKQKKPVVVSMGDYAASGGYYISMGATRIYAEPGTLTGSIGVFGGKLNLAGLYGQLGVQLHTNKRGAFSDLLNPTSDFGDAGREKFRSFLGAFYTTFITKAAEGRGMSTEDLHAVAQGRVWTGEQALERKLIDELGGLDEAVAFAATEAGLEDYALTRMPERKGFFDALAEELANPDAGETALGGELVGPAALAGLPAEGRQAIGALLRLDRVAAAENGVMAILPGELQLR
ncbi:MAG: signal peptide peptidase SppA [Deltaproteobacteria bacterium]|nr:signal peptide peptidase SppA [Deltaproteobacteria bacterium]